MATVQPKLTDEQKALHENVLQAVEKNLNLVINQVESLDHQVYDDLLDNLDNAKRLLASKRG